MDPPFASAISSSSLCSIKLEAARGARVELADRFVSPVCISSSRGYRFRKFGKLIAGPSNRQGPHQTCRALSRRFLGRRPLRVENVEVEEVERVETVEATVRN